MVYKTFVGLVLMAVVCCYCCVFRFVYFVLFGGDNTAPKTITDLSDNNPTLCRGQSQCRAVFICTLVVSVQHYFPLR